MPIQLNPEPGTAAIQLALLCLLFVLLSVAGRLISLLIVQACTHRKPARSKQAKAISQALRGLRAREAINANGVR